MNLASAFPATNCVSRAIAATLVLVGLAFPPPMRAAQATPSSSPIAGQILAETTVASLPPSPSVVAFARLTLAKDVVLTDISVPGPELIAVESGVLHVVVAGEEDEAEEVEERVRRGGTPVAEAVATPSSGGFAFTLAPGDSIYVPGDVAHTIRNPGQSQAIFLAAAVTPQPASGVAASWPPGTANKLPRGVTIEPLDVGYATATSTTVPARFAINRLVGVTGKIMPRQQASGPELFVVEDGTLDIEVAEGTVVTRSSGSVNPQTTEANESAAPLAVQTTAGGAVLVQPGTIATLRSGASGPLTALIVTVLLA
ncbi:MAG: cupin domain-containing protein [Thermomicrobiales bacterium]